LQAAAVAAPPSPTTQEIVNAGQRYRQGQEIYVNMPCAPAIPPGALQRQLDQQLMQQQTQQALARTARLSMKYSDAPTLTVPATMTVAPSIAATAHDSNRFASGRIARLQDHNVADAAVQETRAQLNEALRGETPLDVLRNTDIRNDLLHPSCERNRDANRNAFS